MAVFWVVAPYSLQFTDVSEVFAAFIIRAMRQRDETLVKFYQTIRCNNPEDSHLHTRRPENLKFHDVLNECALLEEAGLTELF
jgi:hypothetical protein